MMSEAEKFVLEMSAEEAAVAAQAAAAPPAIQASELQAQLAQLQAQVSGGRCKAPLLNAMPC